MRCLQGYSHTFHHNPIMQFLYTKVDSRFNEDFWKKDPNVNIHSKLDAELLSIMGVFMFIFWVVYVCCGSSVCVCVFT